MTEDEVLSVILLNEGGFKNDPEDPADPTNFGITAAVAGEWLGLGRRADAVEMQALITPAVAKDIYRKKYIEEPGFTKENVPYEPLRLQLIDFGVNSGPSTAIRWLQRVLQQTQPPMMVTGILDPYTVQWLKTLHTIQQNFSFLPLVNDALVGARSYMIDRLVDAGKLAEKYEEGVESRALSFFLAKPDPPQPVVASGVKRA